MYSCSAGPNAERWLRDNSEGMRKIPRSVWGPLELLGRRLIDKLTIHEFMEHAGCQRLIRNAFLQGAGLKCSEIPRRQTNVDTSIFLEGCFCNLLMLQNYLGCSFNPFELTILKGFEDFLFFRIDLIHLSHQDTV